jgi:hypothetical protein
MYSQARAFHELIEEAAAVRIGEPRTRRAWVLTLEGDRMATSMEGYPSLYATVLSIGTTKNGMSGSPILNDAGREVGMVAVGTENISVKGVPGGKGMQGG